MKLPLGVMEVEAAADAMRLGVAAARDAQRKRTQEILQQKQKREKEQQLHGDQEPPVIAKALAVRKPGAVAPEPASRSPGPPFAPKVSSDALAMPDRYLGGAWRVVEHSDERLVIQEMHVARRLFYFAAWFLFGLMWILVAKFTWVCAEPGEESFYTSHPFSWLANQTCVESPYNDALHPNRLRLDAGVRSHSHNQASASTYRAIFAFIGGCLLFVTLSLGTSVKQAVFDKRGKSSFVVRKRLDYHLGWICPVPGCRKTARKRHRVVRAPLSSIKRVVVVRVPLARGMCRSEPKLQFETCLEGQWRGSSVWRQRVFADQSPKLETWEDGTHGQVSTTGLPTETTLTIARALSRFLGKECVVAHLTGAGAERLVDQKQDHGDDVMEAWLKQGVQAEEDTEMPLEAYLACGGRPGDNVPARAIGPTPSTVRLLDAGAPDLPQVPGKCQFLRPGRVFTGCTMKRNDVGGGGSGTLARDRPVSEEALCCCWWRQNGFPRFDANKERPKNLPEDVDDATWRTTLERVNLFRWRQNCMQASTTVVLSAIMFFFFILAIISLDAYASYTPESSCACYAYFTPDADPSAFPASRCVGGVKATLGGNSTCEYDPSWVEMASFSPIWWVGFALSPLLMWYYRMWLSEKKAGGPPATHYLEALSASGAWQERLGFELGSRVHVRAPRGTELHNFAGGSFKQGSKIYLKV